MQFKRIAVFLMLAAAFSDSRLMGQKTESQSAVAQARSIPQTIIGEVTVVDSSSKQMHVKKSDGGSVIVLFAENAVFSRVPPGEQSMERAIRIAPSEINKGDRLYARGMLSEDGRSVTARSVIIMSLTDIRQKREREQNQWRDRGIAGKVTAISISTREITALVSTREGTKPITIEADSTSTRFRHYAPDSIKFDDTTPSSFSELKVGDQLRAVGERSADGNRFISEEIVFGSFRTIGGTVTAINNQTSELTVKALNVDKPRVIKVSESTMMRRVLPEVASAIVRQVRNNAAAAMKTKSVLSTSGPTPKDSAAKNAGDLQADIENSPGLKLAELKPGDTVLVTVGNTNQPSSPVKAAVLLSGVESVLGLFKPQQNAKNAAAAAARANLNTGLPLDALNGIGVQ